MSIKSMVVIVSTFLVFIGSNVAAVAQSSNWQTKVKTLVAAKQIYPRSAVMRGIEGRALVRVYISATSEVVRTQIVTSSGSSLLDNEALKLPKKVAKFPPPPGGAQTADLSLVWKLR